MKNVIEIWREEEGRATPSTERLMSVAEVARWLGTSDSWVREHASGRKGPHLPAFRMGGLLKFRREDIGSWLVEQKIAA